MIKDITDSLLGIMSENNEMVIAVVALTVFIAFLIDRIKKSEDSKNSGSGSDGGGDNPPTQKK